MQKSIINKVLVCLVIILFIGMSISTSNANIVVQKYTIPNPNGYIQDLIDNASPGDTIYIPSGTYFENIVIDKSITLIGEDRETTIIDGKGTMSAVLDITADNTSIFYFSIRNSNGNIYDNGGIRIRSNNNKISFCDLYSHNNGIMIREEGNIINNCRIFSNDYCGIYADEDNNKVDNCIISNNGIGIDLVLSGMWTITNNKFSNNGIVMSKGSNSPDYIFEKFTHTIKHNTVNGKPLIYIKNQNNICLDDTAVGQIILLNCCNVELKNLDISKTDTPIIIAFGKNVKITNCNLSSNKRNGITIKYGHNIEISDCKIDHNKERGMYILDSTKCDIKDCSASLNGESGIFISNYYSINKLIKNYHISNCELIKNNESGLELDYFCDTRLKINNCIFKENKEHGIFLLNSRKIKISYCIFESNNKEGIYIFESKKININHNNFLNHSEHIYYKSWLFFFFLPRMYFRGNYWDDNVMAVPYYIIKGGVFIFPMDPFSGEITSKKIFDWPFFDWFPARKPYDIVV